MPKVLVSDKLSETAVQIFRDRGVEVDYLPDLGKDKDRLAAVIGQYDGLAIRSATKVTEKLLQNATNLKVIGRAGIGVDNVDIPAASKKGVIVMNTPFGNSVTTAEHAIAMMFAVARQLPEASASTHAGKWEKNRFMGVELFNKTLGVIGAGVISIFLAPAVSRMLRFFPPVVTGTVILTIGVSLMPIGINWIFGLQAGPTAPTLVDPAMQAWLDAQVAAGGVPEGLKLAPTVPNPLYAAPRNILVAAAVLATILLIARFGRGFVANIAVLIGILVGGAIAAALGLMHFEKVAAAAWFAPIRPFHFGTPTFDPVMILTMTMVMLVVMIESTGMFLALSDIVDQRIDQPRLAAGLRADGVGTLLGGIFNTFPYTSFSQNVGLVGVTGVRSRHVCVAGGAIMIVLGLIPKMGALVEALPTVVLGGAGLVMFGMVAATGIRVLSRVDFAANRHNLFVVAVSLGMGMIPMIATNFDQWLPASTKVLTHSGILLAAVSAVALNWFFNGARPVDQAELTRAAAQADAH